jgi:hypothetical protein
MSDTRASPPHLPRAGALFFMFRKIESLTKTHTFGRLGPFQIVGCNQLQTCDVAWPTSTRVS